MICSCKVKETNQSAAVASEPMAMQPAIAHQNGKGIWLNNPLPATASQISSLQWRTPFFADSLLNAGIRRWNASSSWIRTSQWPACRLGHPLQPSGVDPKSLTQRANFTPLLQMPRRHCKTCRSPLHADDAHTECVSCLGKSHADSALSGTDCFHCESFSLASLCSRIAFFSESDSVPRTLPFFSSQGPVRKKQRGRGL